MPDNASDILYAIAAEEAALAVPDPALRTIWSLSSSAPCSGLPRATASCVTNRRRKFMSRSMEPFQCPSARDVHHLCQGRPHRRAAIGGLPASSTTRPVRRASPGRRRRSYSPQLDLEGWILQEGGFKGVAACAASELMYIRLSGGHPPGDLTRPTDPKFPIPDRIERRSQRLPSADGRVFAARTRLSRPHRR